MLTRMIRTITELLVGELLIDNVLGHLHIFNKSAKWKNNKTLGNQPHNREINQNVFKKMPLCRKL